MADLMLDSLRVEGYRVFEKLEIERLGRVNLITGKNNAGKTSLLEALQLYAFRGQPRVILDILDTRDERRFATHIQPAVWDSDSEILTATVRKLFHGREFSTKYRIIRIGPSETREFRTIEIRLNEFVDEEIPHRNGDVQISLPPRIVRPTISISWGDVIEYQYPLDQWERFSNYREPDQLLEAGFGKVDCVFVSASGLSIRNITNLWDVISLTPFEETVANGLRLIAPEVDRVSVSADSGTQSGPIVRAKLKGRDEPVPLRSLGDGMNRIFGITLALVNARNGVLLLDEVENGIHYTVQPDLWRLLFDVARKLNVQVFATTHSYDCITAFQQAANENPEEGVVVRLDKRNEHVTSTLFNEDELTIVTEEGIEVR